METSVKCPCCGGQNLTKPGALHASGYRLHRQFKVNDGSWLGGSVTVYLDEIICVDCGNTMLLASPDSLRELRAKRGSLKWSATWIGRSVKIERTAIGRKGRGTRGEGRGDRRSRRA